MTAFPLWLLLACPGSETGDTPTDSAVSTVPTTATDTQDTEPETGTDDSAATTETGHTGTGDTAPADPTTVEVYLLGGQSNMSGIGEISSLPPSLRTAQDDVWIWSSWDPTWTGLVPVSEYGSAYFGPEVLFGREVGDAHALPVALIKHSVGGTDLARYWHPGQTADDANMGQGYAVWLSTVQAALASLEAQGEVVRIRGMIWMQGESDALVLDDASAYQDNLTHLVERVRQDSAAPELPFALGLIDCVPCGAAGRELVRQAQQAVADADAHVHAFETADLQLWEDQVHYNGPGMRTLGRRFAQALLGEPLSEPVQPAVALTGAASNDYKGDYVVGWRFETAEALRVTDLGWYDLSGSGLGHTHNLGIYDAATGTLQLTATLAAAEAGATPLVDGFRYVGIEPFELPAGDWLIGGTAYNAADPDWYMHHAAIAPGPGVSFTQACYAVGSTLRAPTDWCGETGLGAAHYFGPNLLFGPSEAAAL